MNLSTAEIKYEEFHLLLRRPDHSNIWEFHGRFTQLVGIQHLLEKVTSNGLAETDYNDTLAEFDNHMSTLFNNSDDGIIFLVETYAGKRNYYFYTLPEFDISPFIDRAKPRTM